MPTVYKTNPDYGSGAGPKPKAEVPTVAPEVTPHRGRVRRIIAGQRRPAPTDEEMYAFLIGYARRRERAPQLSEIEARIGCGGDRVLRNLVSDGRILIYVGLKNYRVLSFVAEKIDTLTPKGFTAYRRVDAHGDWWREGKMWKQKQYQKRGRPVK